MTDIEPPAQELPTQFPALQKTEGNFHWHLNIDKSVHRIAAWVLVVLVASSMLIGVLIGMSIWLIQAYRENTTETRVMTQEMIYLQAAVLAHGIQIPHPPGNANLPKEEPEK